MADKWKQLIGLDKSRNANAILNEQHDDKSMSSRNQSGSPATYKRIIADSTIATPVASGCVLRVANTTASVQYISISAAAADVPGAAPTAANGLALMPQSSECFFVGHPASDVESVMIKTSAAGVQVAEFEV